MRFLQQIYFHNTLGIWFTALSITLVSFFLIRFFQGLLVRKLKNLAGKTRTEWDDLFGRLIQNTKLFFVLLLSILAGHFFLTLPSKTESTLKTIVVLSFLLQAALWGNQGIHFILHRFLKRQSAQDKQNNEASFKAIGFLVRMILWAAILLMALDNLGIDITALIAGLGVGGIAVALAVQNLLGDLFASLSIVFDKPFVVGDFIIVDDFLGEVEHIGLKTTRLRSLSGEQVIFSNNDLLQSRIRNYKRMYERRVVFALGVTYQTSHEVLKKIPEIIKEVIHAQKNVRFDRSHFKNYGDSSLNFENVYFVTASDYNMYMDIQQAINLEIYRRFEEAKIEFAYPTQTLYVNKE